MMTLSQISARMGALAAASALSATLLFAAPQAHAATNGSYYKAELAQPTTAKPKLLRSVFVKCEGTSCRAPLASTAPKNMCISIAREFGEVSAFTAGERVFTAEEVAACNSDNAKAVAKN
ncbi:CC_3452 family protein [Sphingorhabdus sp.]|jgi:hypothetical protein|uniref:CC_3452 family protein n=1 Tax=Sphingorhabdus sp. TaxID=1902408 RepID=UPI003783E75E